MKRFPLQSFMGKYSVKPIHDYYRMDSDTAYPILCHTAILFNHTFFEQALGISHLRNVVCIGT